MKKKDAIGERRSPIRKKHDKFLAWCLFLSTGLGCCFATGLYTIIVGNSGLAKSIWIIASIAYLVLMGLNYLIFQKIFKKKD